MLVFKELKSEGADVQNSAVILLWEVRMVPSFHSSFTKLDELDCLQTGDLHEVTQLILGHATVFIVIQLRSFFNFLFLFLSAVEVFEEIVNKFIVYIYHILFDPAIHRPIFL